MNALNSTALTSSSFVGEHFLLLRITITVIFNKIWQKQTIQKKTLGHNVQNQHNVLRQITMLRTSIR